MSKRIIKMVLYITLLVWILSVLISWDVSSAQEPEQYNPVERVDLRGRTFRTIQTAPLDYKVEMFTSSVHYKDDPGDPLEAWKVIEPDFIPSAHPEYDYEVKKGAWQLFVKDDTTAEIVKEGNALSFRLDGIAYLDSATKEYAIIQNRQEVSPVTTNNTIRWNGIFYGVNLVYRYVSQKFVEEIELTETARTWAEANPPSHYGLSNQSSYLVFYVNCDFAQAYPADVAGDSVNWTEAQEYETERINFRHPLTEKIISALPASVAFIRGDPENIVPIRKRFIQIAGENILLMGTKVAELNMLPSGTVIFDPDVIVNPDPAPETDSVDGYVYDNSLGTSWAIMRAKPGTGAVDNNDNVYGTYITAHNIAGQWAFLIRGGTTWATGDALPDTATVTACIVSIYGQGKADGLSATPSVGIYSFAPASNTELVAGDFDSLGTTILSDVVTYAGWDTTGYNDFTLNATGLAEISLTGITRLGLRDKAYDADGGACPWVNGANTNMLGWSADKGGGFVPKMVITYTLPADPGAPTGFTLTDLGATTIQAEYTLDSDDIVIRISRSAFPTSITEGELFYSGNATSANGTGYNLELIRYYGSAWGLTGSTYSDTYATAEVGGDMTEISGSIDGAIADFIGLIIVLALGGFAFWHRERLLYLIALIAFFIYGWAYWDTSQAVSIMLVLIGVACGIKMMGKGRKKSAG